VCAALLIDLISLCGLSQLGDGSSFLQFPSRNTPVSVVGLSSGVSSISLGGVRLTFDLLAVQTLCYRCLYCLRGFSFDDV
jgi:hypothetical protein